MIYSVSQVFISKTTTNAWRKQAMTLIFDGHDALALNSDTQHTWRF